METDGTVHFGNRRAGSRDDDVSRCPNARRLFTQKGTRETALDGIEKERMLSVAVVLSSKRKRSCLKMFNSYCEKVALIK